MSCSFLSRALHGALRSSCIAAAALIASAALVAPLPAAAADASPSTPVASALPGPAPTCIPEVEPNDRPEDVAILSGSLCVTGLLPELSDQDLVFWDVTPAEELITWRITVEGIPTTITSVHVFDTRTEPGVFPVDAREVMRVDSDADTLIPGVSTGVSLRAGRYLLGISRGYPADRTPNPPGSYRVTIEREQGLPASGDVEPNDDAATATPVGNPISLIGDSHDRNVDLYRWAITPGDAATRWQLDVRGVVGDYLAIRLLDATGAEELATTDMLRDGGAHLHDLQLPAGDYLIELQSSTDGPLPYVLTSQPATDASSDPEPNDVPARALPLAIGEQRSGRLTGPRDFDLYSFSVPQTIAATQTDVSLDVGSQVERRLCLRQASGSEIQCRQGADDLALSNLSLPAGDYIAEVSGGEDLADHYLIGVADVGLIVPDREVEPNDTAATATPFEPRVVMRGRSANNDEDHFRLVITGEPQVWRLDATGTGITSLLWVEPDGELRGTADIAADGASASLWDMYLVPGDHWISVESTGEDYTLTMTPLGPRAAGSERESNDDTDNAEPLAVGETRTGRLPGPADVDVFRFSLQAPEHVAIHVDPPADGGVQLRLLAGGMELMRLRDPINGGPLVYDALLQTGDYELYLESDSGSIGAYQLLVERLDPFLAPTDLEPNGSVDTARDLPGTLVVAGSGWGAQGEDDDWYRIPTPPDATEPLVVATSGAVTRLELTDGTSQVGIDPDTERTTWTSRELPPGVPLYLHVTSGGDYHVSVSGGGLVPTAAPADLPLTMSITTEVIDVSAYELFGQRVSGTISLANHGATALDVVLDARTSDDTWRVELGTPTVSIPVGGSVDVPFSVVVPSDAWADVTTRVTIQAAVADGRAARSFVDLTPGRDSTPIGAEQAWPVPDALLGGLDAASLALGASVVAAYSEPMEQSLHDGLALAGAGYTGSISVDPVTFTVELATDQPVPVAGLIVDPLAGAPGLAAAPRAFDLLLSSDGVTYQVALSGELSPRQEDQAFVIDTPVMARFAQLRIRSTWTGDRSSLQIGEWQVIATPGWAPMGAINVADPATGGHVVFAEPGPTDSRQLEWMLTEELEPNAWEPYLEPDTEFSWVIGFRDGRAPQVTELQWVDPPGSDPAQRFDRVSVQVSTDTPLGPWQDTGTWELPRAADGSVPPFTFATPTWARYIRLSGAGPTETTSYWEIPGTLRVIERATDDSYHSILGAWGRGRPDGIRERLEPPDLSGVATRDIDADGNDTPDTATTLTVDVPTDGRIQRGRDVDWYELVIPAGQNTLELTLAAPAAAGVMATLHDSTGAVVPLQESLASEPGVARYVADVEPGATYRVLLDQPPFSTVFSYDTSGSMGSFLSYISGALRSFAADVTPGEEAVQIMPFEDPPLLDDWSDDTWQIEDAITGVFSASGSSAAETSLLAALQELQARRGTRAILAVTDAETSSFYRMGDLWQAFRGVRPIVFTVHVGGGGAPQLTTNLMQDWAHSWGGHYEYAASHGQIDRAFDRLATWLRRPAAYTIGYGASFVSHAPGSLTITPPAGPGGDESVVAGSGVGVEIVLDTSGSMLQKIGKQRRIDIAKSVLKDLVGATLPKGLPVALRIFDPKRQCNSTLVAPLGPLDPASMAAQIKGLKVNKATKTPLAASLAQVASDLGTAAGPQIVVLVTDGEETCKGDPERVIRDLVATGLDVHLNIVGFAIDDAELSAQLADWAAIGKGQSFDAQDAQDLTDGIFTALRAPFRVVDADDQEVTSGVVGGEPVMLPPGTYRVEVLTDPVIVIEDVTIAPGLSRDIQLEMPGTSP